jgi:lysyl-tRNA synthetase class I
VEGVKYLKPYVENWVSSGYLPEEYVFKLQPSRVGEHVDEILSFARDLADSMDATAVHNLVYAKAAEGGVDPSRLFRLLYASLISRGSGPRFGKFVEALGVARVKETLLSLYS